MSDQTWTLEFKALPSELPEVTRYKRLLKYALRSLQLKCVRISGGKADCPRCATPDAPAGTPMDHTPDIGTTDGDTP